MRLAISLLAGVILTGILAYAAYLASPTSTQEISYVVTKPVFETKTFEIVYPVTLPDGKIEKRVRTFDYSVEHMVPEQRVKTLESGSTEKLRYWVLIGSAILCGVYSAFVLGVWMKLTLADSKSSACLVKVEKRLNNIVSFGFGAVAGILAMGAPSSPLKIGFFRRRARGSGGRRRFSGAMIARLRRARDARCNTIHSVR